MNPDYPNTCVQLAPRRQFWYAILLWLAMLAAGSLVAFSAFGQTTKPVGPLVWYQPAYSFPKWQARGIQILFGYENEGGGTSIDTWCAAAKASKLKYILQDAAASHWVDDDCVGAFLAPDEPNAIGNKTPEEMKAIAAALRARTKKPLYLSLNGGAVILDPESRTAAYCASADVITFFSYPYNYSKGAAGVLAEVGPVLDKLRRLAPGKQIVFIGECSDQGIKKQQWVKDSPLAALMHGPNLDEMAFEYGVAVAHGADGLGYFPDIINEGFGGFDGTTPECERVMKNLNALYTAAAAPAVVYVPATQPATQPVIYGNTYVHMRTYDGGKTWRVVVP